MVCVSGIVKKKKEIINGYHYFNPELIVKCLVIKALDYIHHKSVYFCRDFGQQEMLLTPKVSEV